LVYAFWECGTQHSAFVTSGTFPSIIASLHATDVASHNHPQVLLAYYEVRHRPYLHRFIVSSRHHHACTYSDPRQSTWPSIFSTTKICFSVPPNSQIANRHIKHSDKATVKLVVSKMVGAGGLRNGDAQVRVRSAYLILKIVEQMGGSSAFLLEVVGSFGGKCKEQQTSSGLHRPPSSPLLHSFLLLCSLSSLIISIDRT
jgi:hypothetical protein